jgi:hypothetical protein
MISIGNQPLQREEEEEEESFPFLFLPELLLSKLRRIPKTFNKRMMLIMVMVVTHNLRNRTQEDFFHQKGSTESFSRTTRKEIPEFQNIFWKTKVYKIGKNFAASLELQSRNHPSPSTNEQTPENKPPKISKKKETTRAELCIERNLLRRFASQEEDSHGNHDK